MEELVDKEKVALNWDDNEEKKAGLSEILKKVIAGGLSSPFLSEEQLKMYLAGLNLPKEVISQILRGAQKSKDDLVQRVGGEFSKLIQKIDIVKEIKTALREHKISIQADIEFVPKNKPVEGPIETTDSDSTTP
jgi:hypothetical protein